MATILECENGCDYKAGFDIATVEEEQAIRKAQNLKQLMEEVTAEYEMVKRQIVGMLDGREGLISAGGKVTYKKTKDSERTDWKKVVTLVGGAPMEIVRDCTSTVAGSWRFTLSAK